jgi:hypothetical protein
VSDFRDGGAGAGLDGALQRHEIRHPPKVRMTVRIGVTGHRPAKLPAAGTNGLSGAIECVLKLIQDVVGHLHGEAADLFESTEPALRVVSPLAEGADRLVALQGQVLGFELECLLPFARSQYEFDFRTQESKMEFHRLLACARSVRELDGCRDTVAQRAQAYEAAGRAALRNCDLLLAIWDGGRPGGVGGTGQIVAEALAMNLPVIWIKAKAPHEALLLEAERSEKASGRVERPLTGGDLSVRLRPFLVVPGDREARAAGLYYQERWPRGRPALVYDLFRRAMSWPGADLQQNLRQCPEGWGDELPRDYPEVWGPIDGRYGPHSAWADALANHYAARYRSSTVALYLMGATAVLVAFLGLVLKEAWWFFGEFCILIAIVGLTMLGRKRRWHERWIDYRVLAEELRQMQVLALLARVTSSFQVPAHLAHHDPSQTWVTWHFRAVVRQAGLVGVRTDAAYLEACERVLARVVRSQICYHAQRRAELGHLRRRLHYTTQGLFVLAGLACIPHWLAGLPRMPSWLHGPKGWHTDRALSFAGLVLPTVAAALGAIASQSELERIEARSGALQSQLEILARRLATHTRVPDSNKLGQAAQEFADVLLAELVDWRYVFLGKPLVLPA